MKRKSTSRDLSYLALPELTEGSAEELTEPVYERIASRLRELIFSQEIVLGDSLPSLRTVAAKLSVSVDTVRRAYFMCARHERTLQGESPEVRAVAPST